MDKRIVIIDGNSLINRAYYAMQKPMITKEGLYTQGVYGFLNMLAKIIKDYEPGYIVVAFDRKAPTFRHLEYTEYKAGRKKMPTELAMQLPLLKDILDAMKIKMLELDGFEADDIIGTIAREAEEQGLEPLIITGDKDELQLATDITKVIITKKGISEFDLYDAAAMEEKYGFSPQQFIDYKGLMGDQSDNIPGVPGIGEKTAQKLILEYGSVENLISSVDSMTNEKLRTKIEENAQLAMMSKRLATINVNVPIEVDFSEYLSEKPDYDKLINMYIKLEFNSFLKKLSLENVPLNAEIQKKECVVRQEEATVFEIISVPEELKILDEGLKEGSIAAIKVFSDNSHTFTPVIYGISIMSTNCFYYVKTEDKPMIAATLALLKTKQPAIIGHNLKNDYFALMSAGNFESLQTKGDTSIFKTVFDTAIAQYVLDPTRSNYEMKAMVLEYFHEDIEDEKTFMASNGQLDFLTDSSDKYAEYGAKWCRCVFDLKAVLEKKIQEEMLSKVYYDIELPLIEVLASMEAYGFSVDKGELAATGKIISERLTGLAQKIYEYAGEEFNINSPMQIGTILFEKLELPTGKKTKRGYSTGAEVLERLKNQHPIINLILEYRMLAKLSSTYIDGLIPLIDGRGKIHAHFQQTVTATGRISCTEPNLQNIPIKQEFGRTLRKAFVPESLEYSLTGADYSQIELRVLAHMSGDPLLIQAFNEGADIHRSTAARVFGTTEDEVTSLQRSNAKAVNFGVIYGMSSFGLSTELNITRKEAEKYIDEYFKKYVDVRKFMDDQVTFCKANGYVKTIMDRKRMIHEITASNYTVRQLGERLAMNSPIQGSAADIIKIAMIKVYKELMEKGYSSRLILQVHDELIIETYEPEAAAIEKLLTENMEGAATLSVKLDVGLNKGLNWYELK